MCPECGAMLSLNLAKEAQPLAPVEAQSEPLSRVGGVRSSKPRARFNYPDPLFKLFWDVYPRKVGKASAYSKWLIVIREIEPQIVIDAAAQYAKEVEGKEAQFIKYPEGWLTAGRWEDEEPTTTDPAFEIGTPEWRARLDAEAEARWA